MKQIIWIFLITGSLSLSAQVGINTSNPQAILHIDGAGDNASAGIPTAAQQANDVVIESSGKVGIGTISPSSKLEINTQQNNVSGLKFSQMNDLTPATPSKGIGVDISGEVVGHSFTAIIGDVKFSAATADHNGWYLLDGRTVATFSANAQQAAQYLGYATNLPDFADRVLKEKSSTEAIGDLGGNNSLSLELANLPHLSLNGSFTLASFTGEGDHVHGPSSGNYFLITGSVQNNPGNGTPNGAGMSDYEWGGWGSYAYTANGGSHAHSINFNNSYQLGDGIAVENQQPYLSLNTFIYLGE